LVVKNGSIARSSTSDGMPVPVSEIASSTYCPNGTSCVALT